MCGKGLVGRGSVGCRGRWRGWCAGRRRDRGRGEGGESGSELGRRWPGRRGRRGGRAGLRKDKTVDVGEDDIQQSFCLAGGTECQATHAIKAVLTNLLFDPALPTPDAAPAPPPPPARPCCAPATSPLRFPSRTPSCTASHPPSPAALSPFWSPSPPEQSYK